MIGNKAYSDNVRYRVEQDDEPYDLGDLFTVQGLPDVPADERAKMEAEFLDNMQRAGGPWGFIVETKCTSCGNWETVESCWGFDDYAYCDAEAEEIAKHHTILATTD